MLILASLGIIAISLPVWFITIMAVIAGRGWSVATGLVGLAMLGAAAFVGYMAYSALMEEKMEDARYHNMERQVLAMAKKNKGSVTVADLINVGFESSQAEMVLDRMARKGICEINLEATEHTGIITYSFPELIPFGLEKQIE
ncbi:hypothetical protein CUJ83_07410 [Methanocella sp. CWC-04]|uniref:Uncharacterized protein n=2 Tax=Methanooceanicella nereidis TaxID=2052831 RepID=A0AAP2W4W5_9EURY|nr:zinc ribbon domain-containing protein [Methanocella sp. CWC-04]MCD1294825.1 hypothetical protein [Methanocella sp. CWC-04]